MDPVIDGVSLIPLKIFKDERGQVMHVMRNDSPFFESFGESYFSTVNPGIVKGWKFHKEMKQHFCVPHGELKVVMFDDREGSATRGQVQEVILSPENYNLLIMPPQIWYALQCHSKDTHALIMNCTTIPHKPDEALAQPLESQDIPYQFNL